MSKKSKNIVVRCDFLLEITTKGYASAARTIGLAEEEDMGAQQCLCEALRLLCQQRSDAGASAG